MPVAGVEIEVGVAVHFFPPTLYEIDELFDPKPFLFLDLAVTLTVLPFFMPFIVQLFFVFAAVQDFPPAEIVVPVTFEPPLLVPSVTTTVKFTVPFFAELLVIEVIVGALGLTTFLGAALAGTDKTTDKNTEISGTNRFMLQAYNESNSQESKHKGPLVSQEAFVFVAY